MAPKSRKTPSPLGLGDLVPPRKNLPGQGNGKNLEALIDELQRGGALWDRASDGWQVLPAPLNDDDQLGAPAFTCVVGMPTAVGVMKIASDGCGAANCALFVRLKRSVLDAWCDANGEDKAARRAFRRTLDVTQAAHLLQDMQPFCLKEGQVHHPQALSVLCLMTLGNVLTLPDAKETRPPTKIGSFTLVGLPPADPNFEQCLTLLGHKSTFLTPPAATDSDAEEDVPLSSRVDQELWGPTHGTTFLKQWVNKFREASQTFLLQADSKALSTHVPALNRHAPDCARVLEKVRSLFALACKPADKKKAGAPQPSPPPKAKAKVASNGATASKPLVPEPVKKKVGKETQAVTLAPSDPSDNEDSDGNKKCDAKAPKKAAALATVSRLPAMQKDVPTQQTAGSSAAGSKRKRRSHSNNKGGKRRGSASGETSGDEDKYDPMSSAQSSSDEDEEDEGIEDDVVDGADTERDTSDDDDNDNDDDDDDDDDDDNNPHLARLCAASASTRRRRRFRSRKSMKAAAADAKVEAAAAAAARNSACGSRAREELDAREETLRSSMHEIAAQSYEHVLAWLRGERGPAMSEESAFQANIDLGKIQGAKSPMGIVAAMSNLVKTLTNAHHEHFQGETCKVRTADVKRLHAACTQATQFSDATLEAMDRAIEDLTKARDMGRKALERVAALPEPDSEPGGESAPTA